MDSWPDNKTYHLNFNDQNFTQMFVDEFEEDFISHDSDTAKNTQPAKIANVIALGIIFVLALFGNAVVVVILLHRYFKTRRKAGDVSDCGQREFQQSRGPSRMRLTNMQWFMLMLSVADILVAFFTILPQFIWDLLYWFYGGNAFCKAFKYLQVAVMYGSTYCMLMLAIDRYIAVCHHSGSPWKQSRRVAVMTFIAWAVSLLLALPQVFIFSLKEFAPGFNQCYATFEPFWTVMLYVTYFTLVIFLLPLAILVFCYSRICCEIWGGAKCSAPYPRNEGQAGGGKTRTIVFRPNHSNGSERFFNQDEMPLQENRTTIPEAKLKTLKLSLTVIIAFIVCWSPFICVHLWAAYDSHPPFTATAFVVIMRMANLNSCTNPWIYLFFSALWRKSPKDTVYKSFVQLESPSTTKSSNLEMGTMDQGT